ncbi:hypothetical protein M1307_02760 [Patescibacteria group bacterium]|nr:hypothetical protein [Patescibacteria group bacterium]
MAVTKNEGFKPPPNDTLDNLIGPLRSSPWENKGQRFLSLSDLQEIAQERIPEIGIDIAQSVVSQFAVSGRGIARVNGIEDILIRLSHSQGLQRQIYALRDPGVIATKFQGYKRILALTIGIDKDGNLLEEYGQFYARVAKETIQRLWKKNEGRSGTEQRIIRTLKIIKGRGQDIKDIFNAIDRAVGIKKDEKTASERVIFEREGSRKEPKDPSSLQVDQKAREKPEFERFLMGWNMNLHKILKHVIRAGILSESCFENPAELLQVLNETPILASSIGAIRVKKLQGLIGIFLKQNPS